MIDPIPKGRVMPRRPGDLDRDHALVLLRSATLSSSRVTFLGVGNGRSRLAPRSGAGARSRTEKSGVSGISLSRAASSYSLYLGADQRVGRVRQ